MQILTRYVARQVFMATFVVMIVVVGLDLVFSTLDEFNRLGGNYQALEAVTFVSMRIPRRIYEFLPLACLIGCMAGLGSMAANSELTVMRAAGVSINRIGFALLKPIAILMVFNLVLSEWVIPELEPMAQAYQAEKKGEQNLMTNRGRGYWHKEDDTFMRFSSISREGHVIGVSQFKFNDAYDLVEIRRAHHAEPTTNGWLLKDVSILKLKQNDYVKASMKELFWRTDLTSESLRLAIVSPQDMSLYRLYHYVNYLEEQELNSKQYALAMWSKALQPLSAFVLVLLGMSFIFGPLRSASAGYRIFSGILAGLIYKYAQDMLSPISLVSGMPPIWASLLPILICAVLAFYLLKRE